jgi:signal peptidase
MKKILKTIYYLFIACVILIALALLFSAVPIPGNFKVLAVLSGSMEPAIKTGSLVAIRPATGYQVGDIITFGKMSKTNIPTTHRILEVKESAGQITYVTKGDANESADTKEVARREILGKVLLIVPYAGFAVSAAQKPLGFVFIIVVPAGIIIADEIKKIILEIKRMRKEPEDKNVKL